MNRTGMFTSIKDGMTTGSANRIKAMAGCSRKSTSPTSTLAPCASGGIFFKMASLRALLTSSVEAEEYVSSLMSTVWTSLVRSLRSASPFLKPFSVKLILRFSASCRFYRKRIFVYIFGKVKVFFYCVKPRVFTFFTLSKNYN